LPGFLLSFFISLFLISGAAAQKNTVSAVIDNDGVQRVDVLAGRYFFKPDHIIAKVNVPVEIKIRKEPSIVPHDFVIKAPDAGMDILESLSSEPKLIKFTPTKPGRYFFYCDKKMIFSKSHREKGMEGVLEVTE
jgi:plastocyanin domain-containing protein